MTSADQKPLVQPDGTMQHNGTVQKAPKQDERRHQNGMKEGIGTGRMLLLKHNVSIAE